MLGLDSRRQPRSHRRRRGVPPHPRPRPERSRQQPPAGQTSQAVRPDLPRDGPTRRGPAAVAVDPGPRADPEASWLLSRVYLQQGAIAEAQEALARAGSYRGDNPLEDEPSPYVGEARCQPCHAAIFRDSLANRHTQTYYRGAQLRGLPRPDRPLADPTDPKVTHAIKEVDGALWEETRVGDTVLRSLIEYAFGTSERYLTMVSRDARDQYRIVRLSYYHTADGQGWDRTILDVGDPTQPEDFQGEAIGVRAGVASCLYCHITYPRSGRERIGPETADRAIGCERCHGPGGNHLAAVAAGFSDPAIVNPASASPRAVTQQHCNKCHILDRNYQHGDREKPGWVRSQGVGWTWSRCNTESGGAFGCVTCHDPHQGLRSTTTAQYEAKCLACHSAATAQPAGGPGPIAQASTKPGPRVCSVDPARGCIRCHMPGVRTDPSHMDLTDHYIRIPRSSAAQAGRGWAIVKSPKKSGNTKFARPARTTIERWSYAVTISPNAAPTLIGLDLHQNPGNSRRFDRQSNISDRPAAS